jgi:DNA ligase-1
MKPLLAGEVTDPEKINFPVYGSPKYDGIRALVVDGLLVSRTLKPIPNHFIRTMLSTNARRGLDGELMSGSSFQETTGNVMRHEGEPNFTYHVFDDFTNPSDTFEERRLALASRLAALTRAKVNYIANIAMAPIRLCNTWDDVLAYFAERLAAGDEGLMLRSPDGAYKFGRSTEREGILLKLKNFKDSEAHIVGFTELMHNDNAATKDAFGRTKRSSAKAGKRPAGTLGALIVDHVEFGVFEIGTGFSAALRQEIWDNRLDYIGLLAKFRYQAEGMKDKPRIPSFQGIRHPEDL